MDGVRSGEPGVDLRVALIAGGLGVSSLAFTWASGELGESVTVVRGTDLLPAVVLAVGVVVVVALASMLRQPAQALIIHCVGVLVAASAVLSILLVESVASIVPEEVIPVTVRRLSVGVAAGWGLWILAVSGALLILAASGVTSRVPLTRRTVEECARMLRSRWPAPVLLGCATVLGLSRYELWASGAVAGQVAEASGWSLPWAGPTTLVGFWCMVIAAGLALIQPGHYALLVCLLGAWASSFAAAFTVVSVQGLGGLLANELLGRFDELSELLQTADLAIVLGPGASWCFAASVVACFAILGSLRGPGAGRGWRGR